MKNSNYLFGLLLLLLVSTMLFSFTVTNNPVELAPNCSKNCISGSCSVTCEQGTPVCECSETGIAKCGCETENGSIIWQHPPNVTTAQYEKFLEKFSAWEGDNTSTGRKDFFRNYSEYFDATFRGESNSFRFQEIENRIELAYSKLTNADKLKVQN